MTFVGHHCIPYSIFINDLNYDTQADIVTVLNNTKNRVLLFACNNEFFVNKMTFSIGFDPNPIVIVLYKSATMFGHRFS
jgi:hypothetical protein